MNGPRPAGYNLTCKAQAAGPLEEVLSDQPLTKAEIEKRKKRRDRRMAKKKEAKEARRLKEQEALEATKRTAIETGYSDSSPKNRILEKLGLSKNEVLLAALKYAKEMK